MSKTFGASSILTIVFVVICTSFLTALLTRGMAPANGSENIEKAINDFVVKNPQVIGNAVKQAYELEQKQAEAEAKKNLESLSDKLTQDPATPYFGNKDGKVVLVEFFDYNCGYCKRVLPDITALVEDNDDLKVVFKELPILGAMSMLATQVSLAVFADAPDAYWDVHNQLLIKGARSEEAIKQIIAGAKLDVDAIFEKAKSKEIADQIQKHIDLAGKVGIRGTPAFLVGNEIIRGAQGKNVLQAAIDNHR